MTAVSVPIAIHDLRKVMVIFYDYGNLSPMRYDAQVNASDDFQAIAEWLEANMQLQPENIVFTVTNHLIERLVSYTPPPFPRPRPRVCVRRLGSHGGQTLVFVAT